MGFVNTGKARATRLLFEYKQGETVVLAKEYSLIEGEFACGKTVDEIRKMSLEEYLALLEVFIGRCKQREGQEGLAINPGDAIITDVELCPIGQ